jgi:phage gp36-like protein
MIFLTDEDFIQYQVRTEVLSVLKISETSLDVAELGAIEQMTSYLKTRYDTALTFSAAGASRNPLIIMYMIDIILYNLHSNTASRVVPKSREDRFNAAITWLTSVNAGTLIPSLPSLEANNPDPIFRFGSDCRYNNRW